MEKSFGAMLRQLPNKTEVPNLLVDISQTGLAAGPRGEAVPAAGREQEGLLRRAADQHPPDGRLPRDGQVRERHRRAAPHRDAARHRDHAAPGRNGLTDPAELTLNVTAKTYRYLDEEEQAAAEPKDKGKAKQGQEEARCGRGMTMSTTVKTRSSRHPARAARVVDRAAARRLRQRHGRAAGQGRRDQERTRAPASSRCPR